MAEPRFRISLDSGQRLNVVLDLLVVAAASLLAAVVDGQLHWKVALLLAATAWAFWIAGSRVVLQYDVSNGRSLGGDVALTVLLLVAVLVPTTLLRQVSTRYAAGTDIVRFLAVLVPAVLLRSAPGRGGGALLWRAADPSNASSSSVSAHWVGSRSARSSTAAGTAR